MIPQTSTDAYLVLSRLLVKASKRMVERLAASDKRILLKHYFYAKKR